MKDVLEFANRDEFRKWLSYNCLSTRAFGFYLENQENQKQ